MELWQGVNVGSVVPVFKIPLSGGLPKATVWLVRNKKCELYLQKSFKITLNFSTYHGNAIGKNMGPSPPALVGQNTLLLWHV